MSWKEGIKKNRNYILAAVAVLVILTGIILVQEGTIKLPGEQKKNESQGPEGFDEYASANESTGTTDTDNVEVAATFEIQEYGVSPTRVDIKVGQGVKWENTNDYPVYLTFDRTDQEPTIEPHGSVTMAFRGITYFNVYREEDDRENGNGMIYAE